MHHERCGGVDAVQIDVDNPKVGYRAPKTVTESEIKVFKVVWKLIGAWGCGYETRIRGGAWKV